MKSEKGELKFALAGNPNCGKTTLFNRMTGSSQSVGNWPGVTVEKKEGFTRTGDLMVGVVDLPGIYSLVPYSPEEKAARDFLLSGEADLILNIVDATNLERNLYLTTQLAELGLPMVVALNMADVIEKRGEKIDCMLLQKELGVPVLPVSASRGTGVDALLRRAAHQALSGEAPKFVPLYSERVENTLHELEELLQKARAPVRGHRRWLAVSLLESGGEAGVRLTPEERRQAERLRAKIPVTEYVDREMVIADQRYRYLCGVCRRAVQKKSAGAKRDFSAKIDRVVTSRFLGLPLFALAMIFIFWVTFGAPGAYFTGLSERAIASLSRGAARLLDFAGAADWQKSLALDGVLGGVGAVLAFFPQIILLFSLLSFLEDSGYMARAAFMMDRVLRRLGLSGRAFVPLLMGFGCTVPAVMGTRILERERDKRLTVLITPFMSCSAKMPVYSLIISALFAGHQPLVIFSVYGLGILAAVLSALLFKNTLLPGGPAPFVMELPPYRMPTPQGLWLHVWQRLKDFLSKAGSVLLLATVAVWFLQYFAPSFRRAADPSQSILAHFGRIIAPIFIPCGFGEWRQAVSLVTGLVAKESVVSTMRVLYPAGADGSLTDALQQAFSPVSAYAFLIFVLLYTPCVAALSAIRREMGSLKWTAVTIGYQLLLAWFASAFFYQWATLFLRLRLL